MNKLEKAREPVIYASDKFYAGVVEKLQLTFRKHAAIPEVAACAPACLAIKAAATTKDEQVGYLLAVTGCLLQHVLTSPFVEELFNNYLKDYLHFVNPSHGYHLAEFYLTDDFILKHRNKWSKSPPTKIRYI